MELGALVCLPKNPLCRQCPLLHGCFAFRHGQDRLLPVKGKRKPVPDTPGGAGGDRPRREGVYPAASGKWPPGRAVGVSRRQVPDWRRTRVRRGARMPRGIGRRSGDSVQVGRGPPRVFPFQGHPACLRLPAAERQLSAPTNPMPGSGKGSWMNIRFPAANHKFFPFIEDRYLDEKKVTNPL